MGWRHFHVSRLKVGAQWEAASALRTQSDGVSAARRGRKQQHGLWRHSQDRTWAHSLPRALHSGQQTGRERARGYVSRARKVQEMNTVLHVQIIYHLYLA